MKDLIKKDICKLDIPNVMEAIKERMVEYRFNIDDYDLPSGTMEGRRNNLHKVIMGLNRKLTVSVQKDKRKIQIDLKWSSIFSNCVISWFEFFIIAMAVFRFMGLGGFLISIAVGFLGASLNLALFFVLRFKMISIMKRDLEDIEMAMVEGKFKGRMGGFF
ncbi:MAG: hypothetical protein JXA22_03535 [Candidatus Thermoplasmatota archaeon]|nr:hypothetical protein [Candidatus Thermoplasmatota archaeon]